MGCDIHTVIEENVDGHWIGVVASDRTAGRPIYAQRDYDFFAYIANVRGNGPNYPQNLPRDVSSLAWHLYMLAPTDYHNPSFMDLDAFCNAHHKVNPTMSREDYATYDLTNISPEEDGEFRVVFWFDN